MKACWHAGCAIVAALTIHASVAMAQIDLEDLKQSSWDTEYTAADGSQVHAIVTFFGDRGSYEVIDANGQLQASGHLSGIHYQIGRRFFILGTWTFQNGESGQFQFYSNEGDPTSFLGRWATSRGGTGGNWTGRRIVAPAETPLQTGGGQVVYDPNWSYHDQKGYYYKRCTFPQGGYQYLIYFPNKPNWQYWYNPQKQVFWSACPTVNHPRWGDNIRNGEDLFLIATAKSGSIDNTVFPDPGDDGANFTSGTATDLDGSTVALGCPPPDLP